MHVPSVDQRGLLDHLVGFGDRPALIGATETLSYAELAARVESLSDQIGRERRLVLLEASNSFASIIGLLAAWAGRHAVLLTAPDRDLATQALIEAYAPEV